jgi:hydrogenase/urease accessory protein HupE
MRGIVLLIALFIPISAWPHDIGVSKAELTELDEGAYRLRVIAGGGITALFGAPILPDHCEVGDAPDGIQGTTWKTFEFSCPQGLGPEDVLELPWNRDGIMLNATWADGSEITTMMMYESGLITVRMSEMRVGSGSPAAAAKRYSVLGVEHILEGYDHLLFVLALILIVSNRWMLIKTITSFTVAHSITLGLATLGFVNFPSRPVEATIALSIVFLAVEILHARQGRIGWTYRAPWLVGFGFGLLHGFGFAGALSDIGLPQAEVPIALLFFNIGVEIGQLLFIGAVLLLAYLASHFRLRQSEGARVIAAYSIGAVAMFWLFERTTPMIVEIL